MLNRVSLTYADITQLPHSVVELLQLHAITLDPDNNLKGTDRYLGALTVALRDYRDSRDTNIHTALAEHLLNRLEHRLFNPKHAIFPTNLFEVTLQLLTNTQQIDVFINNPRYASLIAHACLRVAVTSGTAGEKARNQALQVLTEWTGAPVNSIHMASLKNAVDFIYGPAIWPLCREDVTRDEQFPSHLWSLKLQPRVAQASVGQLTAPNLPNNISE